MSSATPEVSVVIPTYNRASTIASAVNSVLRQTYEDIEVIVVDDCSRDDTLRILDGIRDPRLRVIRHDTNQGGSAARNTGIRTARGALVAFQDSDDEWLSTKLERQVAAIESAGAETIGVYCGMVVVGSANGTDGAANDATRVSYVPRSRPGAVREGYLKESLLRHSSFISTQTFMVRRDVILGCGGFDDSLKALQDWDCFLRVAEHGRIAYVPEPLVVQRFSPDSLTRSVPNRVVAMQAILEKHKTELQTMPKTLARYYRILGGGYRSIGRPSEARGFYLLSLRCDPLSVGTWLRLGQASFQGLGSQAMR